MFKIICQRVNPGRLQYLTKSSLEQNRQFSGHSVDPTNDQGPAHRGAQSTSKSDQEVRHQEQGQLHHRQHQEQGQLHQRQHQEQGQLRRKSENSERRGTSDRQALSRNRKKH